MQRHLEEGADSTGTRSHACLSSRAIAAAGAWLAVVLARVFAAARVRCRSGSSRIARLASPQVRRDARVAAALAAGVLLPVDAALPASPAAVLAALVLRAHARRDSAHTRSCSPPAVSQREVVVPAPQVRRSVASRPGFHTACASAGGCRPRFPRPEG
jgi:hypothetical protein